MSFLDLYQGDQTEALRTRPNEGHDLPSTFADTFGAAWTHGRLFEQSVSHENARMDALGDYIDDVKAKTGVNIGEQMDWTMSAPGVGDVTVPSGMLVDQASAAVKKLKEKNDTFDIAPIDDAELDKRAIEKSRKAGLDFADMAAREKTFGGKLGMFAGDIASAATDPINIAALPFAPETGSVGILAAALRWGAVAGLSQAAIEAAGAPYREAVTPGYLSSAEPLGNVASAALGGAVLGGGTKLLGNAWTRVKTGAWPTAIRDAGNLVENEANIANTNPFHPSAENEVAHRTALGNTIDDMLKGNAPDVDKAIPPEAWQSMEERLGPLLDERNKAAVALRDAEAAVPGESPELPFQQSAAMEQAMGHMDAMADQITRLAQDSGYAMPRHEAQMIAERLARAPDEQVQSDAQALLSNASAATERAPAAVRPEAAPEPISVAPPEKVLASPEHEQAIRADIDRERMTGDRQIPVGVDERGEPVYRSLDAAMTEVDAYKTAAEHIQACANPVQEPTDRAA